VHVKDLNHTLTPRCSSSTLLFVVTHTRSLDQVIGASLRAFREAGGLHQDRIAAAARAFGLAAWTRPTVAAIESGRRHVSNGEMAVLPLVLAEVSDGLVRTVADLLPDGDEPIALGPGLVLPIRQVKELLGGHATSMPTPDVIARAPSSPALEAQDDAVQKAAAVLRVRPDAVVAAAHRLWGRSLTEEREERLRRRLGPDPTSARRLQALRGHTTRELLDELRPLLKKSRGRKTR
jgi:transcriptional regulator with XRE-family HTH domain